MRLMNTGEAAYKYAHGNYAARDELFRSGVISEREKPITRFQGLKLTAGPRSFPDGILPRCLFRSAHYELSLRSVDDKR